MGLLDGILILLVLASAFRGWRWGMIKTVLYTFSYVIAYYLAGAYYPRVSAWIISNTQWLAQIEGFIDSRFDAFFMEYFSNSNDLSLGAVGDFFRAQVFSEIPLEPYVQDAIAPLRASMVEAFSTAILNVVVMIGLFLAIRLLLNWGGAILNQFFKLPVLNLFNQVGGAVAGAISGIFVSVLIVGILMILSLLWPMEAITRLVEESLALQWVMKQFLPQILTNSSLL